MILLSSVGPLHMKGLTGPLKNCFPTKKFFLGINILVVLIDLSLFSFHGKPSRNYQFPLKFLLGIFCCICIAQILDAVICLGIFFKVMQVIQSQSLCLGCFNTSSTLLRYYQKG